MREKLAKLFYKAGYKVDVGSAGIRVVNTNGVEINIIGLHSEPSVDYLLSAYNSSAYLLFIVTEQLLDASDDYMVEHERLPDWLRILHACHFGRVYFTDGDEISVMHWDRESAEDSYYGPIPDKYLVEPEITEQNSWLRDYPGVRKVAKFGDGTWWKGWEPDRPAEQPKTYTWARGGYTYVHTDGVKFSPETERIFREAVENTFRRNFGANWHVHWPDGDGSNRAAAREAERKFQEAQAKARAEQRAQQEAETAERVKAYWENMFKGVGRDGNTSNVPPGGAKPPVERVFGLARHYAVLGVPDYSDLATAKAAYYKLARENHPDINPGPEATAKMQEINAAWEAIQKALK